jgi:hypothetical protein
MESNERNVHQKDRTLFLRIDATLAAYDAAGDEPVPSYLQTYAEDLEGLHTRVRAQRRI